MTRKRLVWISVGAILGGLVLSVALVALTDYSGAAANAIDLAQAAKARFITEPLHKRHLMREESRGRAEARGDLARGDHRLKVFGLRGPYFKRYQSKAINQLGVGIDALGCLVDEDMRAYVHGYNSVSWPAIDASVGGAKLEQLEHAAQAEWEAEQGVGSQGGDVSPAESGDTKPNSPIKPSAHPVTRLATARRAPVWPAAYRERWTDTTIEGIVKIFTMGALMLAMALSPALFSADKRDPRFGPEGERRILELTRWLEENPLGDTDKSRRAEVTKWWIDVPSLSLNWCAGLLLESKKEAVRGIVVSQSLFGAGAYLIAHRTNGDDQLAISLAGVESALRAYQNAVKTDPALKDPVYEKLAAEVGTEALTDYVKTKLKECAEASSRAK